MSTAERLTLMIPAEVADALRATVAAGEFESVDAIVDHVLRQWIEKSTEQQPDAEQLRNAVERSDASGPGVPAEQAYAYLRERIARRHAA